MWMTSALRVPVLRYLRIPAIRTMNLRGRNWNWSRNFHIAHPDPAVEKQIKSVAEDIIRNYPSCKSVMKAIDLVTTNSMAKSSSGAYDIRIISYMIELMKKDPEFDQLQVFRLSQLVQHQCLSDGTEHFTREEVTSMVLQIAKSYPYICPSKMTEEASWDKDLGLRHDDCTRIILSLQNAFKLVIPGKDQLKINSVRFASEYIFNHLGDRVHTTEFVEKLSSAIGSDHEELDLDAGGQFARNHDNRFGEGKAHITNTVLDIVQNNHDIKSPYKVLSLVDEHPKVKISSHTFKLNVMCKVFEYMLNDPDLDPVLAHTARVVVSLYSSDENMDLKMDEVISKVFAVVKSYRNVCPSKVTEEANFSEDLGLDKKGLKKILCHLQYEFKLFIPHEDAAKINSVKTASDYIYDHLDQRLPKLEVMKKVSFINHDDDDLFW